MFKSVARVTFVLIAAFSSYLPCFADDPPAVEPQLRTGCEFSEQALDEMSTQSTWFHIPWWLAGTWKRERSITYVPGERPNIKKDERVRKFGFQTDAKGGIWHYVRTPFKVVTHTRTRNQTILPPDDMAASCRQVCRRQNFLPQTVPDQCTGKCACM